LAGKSTEKVKKLYHKVHEGGADTKNAKEKQIPRRGSGRQGKTRVNPGSFAALRMTKQKSKKPRSFGSGFPRW